jgi:hypothetical protein
MSSPASWPITLNQRAFRPSRDRQKLYALQDANFNVTAITDFSGNVQERYVFDPYGDRVIMSSGWIPTTSSAYGWFVAHQGLIVEESTGLINNRERMIQQERFSTRNRLGYVDGPSLYEYEGSSPLNALDSSGLPYKIGGGTPYRRPAGNYVNTLVCDIQPEWTPVQYREISYFDRGTGSPHRGCKYVTMCEWIPKCPDGSQFDPNAMNVPIVGRCDPANPPGWKCRKWKYLWVPVVEYVPRTVPVSPPPDDPMLPRWRIPRIPPPKPEQVIPPIIVIGIVILLIPVGA